MNICLIPARIGSKRVKLKNMINFFGKPIIYYSIKTALNSKLFDKIIVSTDSKKIAKIANKYGAETPFIRPKSISSDSSSDFEVLNHFYKFTKLQKINLKYLCYLYPTASLITVNTLKKCLKSLKKNKKCQKVITICKFRHPIDRALKKDKKNNILFKNKDKIFKRSQKLPVYYHDAAQCYWYNFKKIKNLKKTHTLVTKGILLGQLDFHDIDDKEDLDITKKLFKIINKC